MHKSGRKVTAKETEKLWNKVRNHNSAERV